ncbi:pyridine nucleotide-disulfide oxidoreductase [Thecamonas trahens ATCC 50062]|uniref:Pyridine nucleotide-disulfide oxidoreductase n=1 Tax=Thecamonas trahens ATCC 50062 TaxID=461836 RepID=A0A0L0DSW5_THETB|nr:pyridine nucleotide-disulfide oxidoreductase [Thecamonas trahens ATCC 50062]KNC55365.1 pyridine nucleotide-disulfide oxidoreductase [Thecamonas trahens ATCC 50062]|eukprot:XP_013752999.1 pyridine nucleotide-disulfide oxidoreductase [Thecamonas trahens ATCC 50062]
MADETTSSCALKAPRVVIVGGVAGGASCATRLRRMCEGAQITMVERGPYISFATCGLPYHVGKIIPDETSLRVATPELLRDRFGINVRVETEAVRVNVEDQSVAIQTLDADGSLVTEELTYDYLVLATGAAAVIPPWPGVDLPGVFTLRSIPHARVIREWIAGAEAAIGGSRRVRTGIVGAGFIGLELADALVASGVDVVLLEYAPQIMPPMDREMADALQTRIEGGSGDALFVAVGDGVIGFRSRTSGHPLEILTAGHEAYPCDLVVVAVGVKAESGLARDAGIALGARGAIAVDASFRTSDPRVFAVGDVVETADRVTGRPMSLALAGPANRAGRIVADTIVGAGRAAPTLAVRTGARMPGSAPLSRGVLATWVCGAFGFVAAGVGASARALDAAGMDYAAAYVVAGHHVGYYPGAKTVVFKLLYSRADGRILGAQAVGEHGVERRIDVIATAMHARGSVYDLVDLELAYAPAFGAARDIVNMVGMVAVNDLDGIDPLVRWGEGGALPDGVDLVLDVRGADEVVDAPLNGAIHVPLHELRSVLADEAGVLAGVGDQVVGVVCAVGRRAHVATCLLRSAGIDARTVTGGMAVRGQR